MNSKDINILHGPLGGLISELIKEDGILGIRVCSLNPNYQDEYGEIALF